MRLVALGCSSQDRAAVRKGRGAGEMGEEEGEECKGVGVDGLVVFCGYIRSLSHSVGEAINTHHDWRAVGQAELADYELEDWPCGFGVRGAEKSEAGEGDVGCDRNWDFGGGAGPRKLDCFEDGVGARYGGEEGGCVGFLGVLGWCGVGDGGIFCMADDEFSCCE